VKTATFAAAAAAAMAHSEVPRSASSSSLLQKRFCFLSFRFVISNRTTAVQELVCVIAFVIFVVRQRDAFEQDDGEDVFANTLIWLIR
jgi:hypothetical protein